jgi:uncharacterized protein with PhoU and TrkA domain
LCRHTSLDVTDYASLLRLAGDYRVSELEVRAEDWIEGCTLAELKLRDEGVMVLGLTRDDGRYVGTPGGTTKIRAGDVLVLYGREETIEWLDQRPKGEGGDRDHDQAVSENRAVKEREAEDDESSQS